MQIISEAQILQISAQRAAFPCARRAFPWRNYWGRLFGSVESRLGWAMRVWPGSRPCCGFQARAGGSTNTEQTPLSRSAGPCLQDLLQQDTGWPHWPLRTSKFQEWHWNTKPHCQRHLASADFHHKTLRHENLLPCDSSGCLMPGEPWPCWKSCQAGPWSHPAASVHRELGFI